MIEPKCVFHPECEKPAIHPDHPLCVDHAVDLIVATVQAAPHRCILARPPEPE